MPVIHRLTARRFKIPRGLTYGEMLVVLVVFALLALMFIFSSSYALTKTRLSRVMHEQRLIVRALSDYEAQTSDLPAPDEGLEALLHPISYMTTIPIDPFIDARADQRQYQYYASVSPRHRSVIISVGPDGDSDLGRLLDVFSVRRGRGANGPVGPPVALMTRREADVMITQLSYDPTNGTISNGDIIHVYTR
jgi:type II secretory pathway pseudopilin PulG